MHLKEEKKLIPCISRDVSASSETFKISHAHETNKLQNSLLEDLCEKKWAGKFSVQENMVVDQKLDLHKEIKLTG